MPMGESNTPIRFGTDGWRALVAEEFTLPNVRAVAQAMAEYFKTHRQARRPLRVIVGYDTRPLGDRFAQGVAEVMAGNGLEVLLTDRPMPTPAVSFAIRALRLQGGVVVTASHNPFTYNGLKFKPFYAGPAEPAMTRWVERRLFRKPIQRLALLEGVRKRRIKRVDLIPRYLTFLRGYVDWAVLRQARLKVAYDAMRGAGQDLLQRAAEGSRLRIVPIEDTPWPVLSDHRPEPVGEHLRRLALSMKREHFDVGLATDGDADRLGVVGPEGRFVSSQETMALLLWHLLEDRGMRGMVVTTVAGTNLVDEIAECYRVPLKRTPVGFKHITRWMRTDRVLFGGEESGGFGFRGCVPERDGLLAGLLLLEMMAMRGKGLLSLQGELRTRFGHWVYRRTDLALVRPVSIDHLVRWAKAASSAEGKGRGGSLLFHSPKLLVRKIDTWDGVKVILKDRSWLLLRPSGTEPLLRIYAEARSEAQVSRLLEEGGRIGKQLL
jgi:alpha-D-glucose phosphate-specific phosphoglucomutase